MTPLTDAQLAEIEARFRKLDGLQFPEANTFLLDDVLRDFGTVLAALRDARAENERLKSSMREWMITDDQRMGEIEEAREHADIAEGEYHAVVRREAELRARIEALCEHWQDEVLNGHGAYREVNERRLDQLRAALFPAEEAPSE